MSQKSKKQFGVWMDSHHATVVGKSAAEAENFSILGHAEDAGADFNTSEKNAHNDEKTLQYKFFLKKYLHTCKMLKKCILRVPALRRNSLCIIWQKPRSLKIPSLKKVLPIK